MDRAELQQRYTEVWSNKDVAGLLRLMHPQGSYYDAFWGQRCTVGDLHKYFCDFFEQDRYWYLHDDEAIDTPNGLIIRYTAFDQDDTDGTTPIYKGAEVITTSGRLIMTISDFYCAPDPVDLIAVAALAEKLHSQSHVAPLGLSAQTSACIQRRLAELASEMTVFLDPELTVTKLADHVNCSVMHLFHVLEEEQKTSYVKFVNAVRAKYASTLIESHSGKKIKFHKIAKQSGFENVADFHVGFHTTFGIAAEIYRKKFARQ
jgi:AraC-like DNA-binding protein